MGHAVVQQFLGLLRHQRKAGGLLFVDFASAYYSVIRQTLFPSPGRSSSDSAEEDAPATADEDRPDEAIVRDLQAFGLEPEAMHELARLVRDMVDELSLIHI